MDNKRKGRGKGRSSDRQDHRPTNPNQPQPQQNVGASAREHGDRPRQQIIRPQLERQPQLLQSIVRPPRGRHPAPFPSRQNPSSNVPPLQPTREQPQPFALRPNLPTQPTLAMVHEQPLPQTRYQPQPSSSRQTLQSAWHQPSCIAAPQSSQEIPPIEQTGASATTMNRRKFSKRGGHAAQQPIPVQQQIPQQVPPQSLPAQQISQQVSHHPIAGKQQMLQPKTAPQQEVPLAQQMQQQLVIKPAQIAPPTTSGPPPTKFVQGGARKSTTRGFQPLEVLAGSCVGTRGQKLKIEVNYLRIQIDGLVPKAYHYDIRFDPEKIPRKLLQDVVEKFRTKCFPKHFIAYDGQNSVYSASPLPLSGNVLREEMLWHDGQTNRDRTIIITLKETDTCVIDMSAIKKYVYKSPGIAKPLRAIQCLEIVLRMPFSGMFVNVNRSFFTRPNRTIDLGENYELWTGLYQSVVLGDVPLFNIDVVNKPFPSSRPVLNILTDLMRVNLNQAFNQPDQLHDYLKGLMLVYKQPGTSFSNVFKYNGLKGSARTQTFMQENRKMTVEAYFKEKNIQLHYPQLPCLWCGPPIKNIYLPLEFCSIQDGQVIRKKLSENQIRTVIAETATSTDVRKRRIMDLLAKIRHNESNVVKQFGVNIGDKFTEVEARILPAPGLEYLSNLDVKVDRGVWNAEREKFLDGQQCTHWSVLKLDDRCPNSDIFKLADMICELGRKANMSFAPKFTDLIEMRSNARKQDIEQKMMPLKRKNVELLFVIIPNRNEAYPNVKQVAELKCGILTQCIKSFTLARKLNGSTVYNILLKLNSKLNGFNHKVAVRSTPPIGRGKIMLVGADVTHPTGTLNEPSAVGVAASHDINGLKYNMCWRLQTPTQEMITDLKNIMAEQLHYYKKCMNNELPDKILYYRDGVSDGQFEDVLNTELSAIYLACQQMAPSYKPPVTFIVVQKRHNTRFYPGASRVSCGKNNNVMPGTIVDKFIIDPRHYQFFLVSHAAIQGVARPTKYCVIWDDSNIKADELQALTHNLCHVFTRCNRAVSYAAPTYYAHLAAYRGKVYIQNERINMNNLEQEFNQRQIREEISKGHPMFFV